MTHILVAGKGGNMGKFDSPENATKQAKCLVASLGQIHFRNPDFLSVELVEGTSIITGPKCNKGPSVITLAPKCNKGFICHD